MKQMDLQVVDSMQKSDDATQIFTFFHTNEPLEWLIRHMLQDAYNAGFTDGKAALQNHSLSMLQKYFFEFYIAYVDRDLKSTIPNSRLKRDDHYNTLLDLITRRERMQWYSGFHEGCACVTHEKRAL